jgi:hypothetical protein
MSYNKPPDFGRWLDVVHHQNSPITVAACTTFSEYEFNYFAIDFVY